MSQPIAIIQRRSSSLVHTCAGKPKEPHAAVYDWSLR